MNLNFADVLVALGSNAGARISNGARPPANYLFNTFLPERLRPDYHVEAANMLIRTTMAGLVGMDSPYPTGGAIETETFLAQSAKLALTNNMSEGSLRELQALLRQLQFDGTLTNDFLVNEALNYYSKVIVQGQLDRAEWLRSQALNYGAINWTFNSKPFVVDYMIPAANKLTTRTDTNNDSYSDTGSKWWADVAAAEQLLRYSLRAIVMNTATLYKIINNPANQIVIISQSPGSWTISRTIPRDGNTIRDTDARYTVTITVYDEEVEVLDTTAGTGFGGTQIIKLQPDGKVLFVGSNGRSTYRVGEGSTTNPRSDLEVGYHHIAPTVEGGGNPGRWGRMYVPEGYPMNLRAEGASNELPVILNPDKIVIATTEMLP